MNNVQNHIMHIKSFKRLQDTLHFTINAHDTSLFTCGHGANAFRKKCFALLFTKKKNESAEIESVAHMAGIHTITAPLTLL